MKTRWLPAWQVVALVAVCIAVLAISAVALILGKEAVIAIAVILFLTAVLLSWFLDLF